LTTVLPATTDTASTRHSPAVHCPLTDHRGSIDIVITKLPDTGVLAGLVRRLWCHVDNTEDAV